MNVMPLRVEKNEQRANSDEQFLHGEHEFYEWVRRKQARSRPGFFPFQFYDLLLVCTYGAHNATICNALKE